MATDPLSLTGLLGPKQRKDQTKVDPLLEQRVQAISTRRNERISRWIETTSPDAIARANRVANEVGLPPEQIDGDVDYFEGRAKTSKFLSVIASTSTLSGWAGTNPRAASMAADDADNLSLISKAANGIRKAFEVGDFTLPNVGGALKAGWLGAEANYKGLWEAANRSLGDDQNAAWLAGERKRFQSWAEQSRPEARSRFGRDVLSGIESIPLSLSAAAATLATRSPAVGLTMMGTNVAGGSYGDAVDEGVSHNRALIYGLIDGSIEVGTEMMPTKLLLGDIVSGKGLGRTLFRQALSEIPGEQAATLLQNFNRWITIDQRKGKTFEQFVEEIPDEALSTLVATITMTSTVTTGTHTTDRVLSRLANRRMTAAQTRDANAAIDELAEAAAGSKLRERDPKAFAELLQAMGGEAGVEKIFVAADAAREFMQSDSYDGSLDPWADEIADAAETGGEVAIDVGQAFAQLEGTGAWAALRPDMRLSPGGMTQREAEDFEANIEDVTRELARSVAQDMTPTARETLFDKLVTKLQDAGFTPSTARVQAELLSARYATRAERLGVDLTGNEFDGVTVEQALPEALTRLRKADALDLVIDTMQRGKEGGAAPGASLLEWVSSQGGVEDPGGDLAAMDIAEWHKGKPGRRKLLRDISQRGQGDLMGGSTTTANTLDDMALRAWEAGYFPEFAERPSVQDMIDAIDAELRGKPRYTESEDAGAREAADELRALLASEGIDETASREEIRRAVDAYTDRQTAQFGYEQAALPEKIEVDGKERWTVNSNGLPIASDEAGVRAFYEWFGDSKVVDNEGRPLVVYHGTNKGGFDRFDTDGEGKTAQTGAFFTPNVGLARTYTKGNGEIGPAPDFDEWRANPEKFGWAIEEREGGGLLLRQPDGQEYASDEETLGYDFEGFYDESSEGYYAAYLSLQDPEIEDLEGANWDGSGGSVEWVLYDADGTPVDYFDSQEDAEEAIDEDDAGFYVEEQERIGRSTDDLARDARIYADADGAIFKNLSDDGPYGGGYSYMDDVYVAFSPEQIKSVHNRGTFAKDDPRILYQSDSEGRPLVTVHNLSEENFRNAEELGGLAAPSIAVIRADLDWSNFGEITLIASPDLIDPQRDAKAKGFNADVYSPRQPRAQFDLHGPTLKQLNEDVSQAVEDLQDRSGELEPDRLSREGLSAIENSTAVKLTYLRSIGEDVQLVYDEKTPVDKRLRKFGRGEFASRWNVADDEKFVAALTDVLNDDIAKMPEQVQDVARERYFNEDGSPSHNLVQRYADQAVHWHKPRDVSTYKTRERIDKRLNATKKRHAEYRLWVQDNYAGIVAGRFFETRDSGRRKSYTMENLVREMTRTIRDGEGYNYGIGSLRSNVAKQFRSIEGMQAARDSIVSDEEMEAVKSEVSDEMFALADKFKHLHGSGNDFGWADIFTQFLKDLAIGRPADIREWQNEIFREPASPELMQEARDFLEKLKGLPTEYFEVKMQRAVDFDEFAAAVVPDDTAQDVIDGLKAHGLSIEKYPRGQSRSAAIQKAAGASKERILFQAKPTFYSALERAIEQTTQAKASGDQWLATLSKTPGVKKEEIEWTELPEWLEAQDGPVAREDLLAFVKAGGVQVEEVTLGGDITERLSDAYENGTGLKYYVDDEGDGEFVVRDDDGKFVERYDNEDEAEEHAALWNDETIAERTKTQFAEWKEEGGEDYRELLITLPKGVRGNPDKSPSTHWSEDSVVAHTRFDTRTGPNGEKILFVEEVQSDWHQKGRDQGYEQSVDAAEVAAAKEALRLADEKVASDQRALAKLYVDAAAASAKENAALLNDRDWPDLMDSAKSVLTDESALPANQVYRAERVFQRSVVLSNMTEWSSDIEEAQRELSLSILQAREALNTYNNNRPRGIPDAPFKSSWPALVMKRLVRYAADNGFDQVAWATGEQNANRYDLTETVGGIKAVKQRDGRYLVSTDNAEAMQIIIKNGMAAADSSDGDIQVPFDAGIMTAEQMKEAFGGNISKQLVEGADASFEAWEEGDRLGDQILLNEIEEIPGFDVEAARERLAELNRTLPAERGFELNEGDDLKVGGEGMKAFYDRNLPNITNKVLKPMGGKVKPLVVTDFANDDSIDSPLARLNQTKAMVERLYTTGGRRSLEAMIASEQDAERKAEMQDALRMWDEAADEVQREKGTSTKPTNLGFDITPEMREAAQKGQALFQQFSDGPRGRIIFPGEDFTGQATIQLFQARNLSTFLHESGHLFLEELRADAELARQGEGEQMAQLVADFDTVAAWFAENGHAIGEDGAIPVEAHEMWARGVERFLMEGKAPSAGLRRAFETFKGWLINIYRSVAKLNAPITDDIRDVMRRLVATDQEIAEAAQQQELELIFDSAAAAGMSEAEFTELQRAARDARGQARDELLKKVMAPIRARVTKEYKDRAAAIRGEIAEGIDNVPVFRAMRLLKDTPMSTEWIVDNMGEDMTATLPPQVPPVHKKGGANPADVAERAGFNSPEEMIDALRGVELERKALREKGDKRSVRNKMIDERVEETMRQRYGDPFNDGSIEEEALAVIHNDAEGEVLSAELRVLGRKNGKRPTPYRIARNWARDKVRSSPVNEVASASAIQRYSRAAAKAGKAAFDAAAGGDIDEAFSQKQRQMLNNALIAEARAAKDEIDAAIGRMEKLAKRRTLKSTDQDYLERAQGLLEAVDFTTRSQSNVDRQAEFEAWAREQEADGIDLAVPPSFAATLGQTHWSRLPVDRLLALDAATRQIMHLGRLKQTLQDRKEQRDFDELVREFKDVASGLPQKPISNDLDPGWWDGFKSKVIGLDAALLKIEQVVDWLDNGNDNGVFNRIVFGPIADAQDRENDMMAVYNGKLRDAFSKVDKKMLARWSEPFTDPRLINRETGAPFKMKREQLISMALNMGNEGNIQRLTDGYGWSERNVRDVLGEELSAEEWAFVQEIWDVIDSLWPEIAAMERRVNGIAPDKVEPVPVETPHGVFKGGYFPAVYDSRLDYDAEKNSGKETDLFEAKYTRATTRASATKDRANAVKRPILLNLGVINRHMQEVIHDITHREAVMQAHKFVTDRRVMKAIDETLGPEYRKMFRPWVKFVANSWAQERAGNEAVGAFMTKLRANTTVVGMGFRFSTIVMQIAGLSNSFEKVGARWVGPAIGATMKSPVETFQFVMDRSGEVRHRMDTLDRDIRLTLKKMSGRDNPLTAAKRFAFHGIGYMDRVVTIPTWMGAYNKALAGGMTEAEAAKSADKAIRLSQGAASPKDLAAVATGQGRYGEMLKLMTMFYSYLSTVYARQRNLGRDIRNAGVKDVPGIMARAWWLVVLPPLLAELLAGRGPEDDEDWGMWAFEQITLQSVGAVPVLRDASRPLLQTVKGERAFDYAISPVQRAVQTGINSFKDGWKIAQGKDTKRATRNALETVGYFTGLVPGQVAQSTQFLVDVAEGDQNPRDFWDWWEGITSGKIKDD